MHVMHNYAICILFDLDLDKHLKTYMVDVDTLLEGMSYNYIVECPLEKLALI